MEKLFRLKATKVEVLTFLYRKTGNDIIKKLIEVENSILQESENRYRPYTHIVLLSKLFFYVFGISFVIKWLERLEENELKKVKNPELLKHEKEEEKIIWSFEDERERYIGSTVLGMNDALVEMSGALTGLTTALTNVTLIAVSSLAVGISASLSMAASEYLSRRAEGDPNPLKAAGYTGIAYFSVVMLLVAPYFFIPSPFLALFLSLTTAVLLIAVFSYYVSVVKNRSFVREFMAMVSASMGVALVSFLFTTVLKEVIGIEV